VKRLITVVGIVLALALTACGGGGSTSPSDNPTLDGHPNPDNQPTPGGSTVMSPANRATTAVGVVSSVSPVNGTIPAGSAKNLAVAYHGPASDGELVQFIVNFSTLQYWWTVAESSFAITGQTGSGTLVVDPSGAGYTMSEGGTLFITNAGGILVDGLVLRIDGLPVPQAVFAQPATVENVEISDITGDYVFGQFTHNVATHAPFPTDTAKVYWGAARVYADGVMRMCVGGDFSPTCANYIVRKLVVNDAKCNMSTNLVATYKDTQFIGCMIVSTNGIGSVLHVDIQAGVGVDPGITTLVQKSAVVQPLPNGTYAAATVVDLSNGTDGCANRNIVVSNAVLTAVCAGQTEGSFQLGTNSLLPPATLVMMENGQPTDMFLQLASDLWMAVSPTSGWLGTDKTQFGSMGIIKRLN
jgi:hypothetical protein